MPTHSALNLIVLVTFICLAGCTVHKDPQVIRIKQLQKGKVSDDTSFVYQLPYADRTSHRLVQGYFSSFSHKSRAALDFKMKRGTMVCAARRGIVVRVKEDGNKGGWKRDYRPYGNVIIIQHNDGSRAGYWHLQYNGAIVTVGDSVKQGQPIGYSGKTGYTLFPHLHFIVWRSGSGGWQHVATRFQTAKGIQFLRPLKKYKRMNETIH